MARSTRQLSQFYHPPKRLVTDQVFDLTEIFVIKVNNCIVYESQDFCHSGIILIPYPIIYDLRVNMDKYILGMVYIYIY